MNKKFRIMIKFILKLLNLYWFFFGIFLRKHGIFYYRIILKFFKKNSTRAGLSEIPLHMISYTIKSLQKKFRKFSERILIAENNDY